MANPSERLRALGIQLPRAAAPIGSYQPVLVEGSTAWVSGQIVLDGGVAVAPGRVDEEVPVDRARVLARRAMIQALGALAETLGSIDRIRRIVRVTVYVASSSGFDRPHEVANGATDLLLELFGPDARPTRVSVGVARLPLNAPVEVDCVASIA